MAFPNVPLNVPPNVLKRESYPDDVLRISIAEEGIRSSE